MAVAVAWIPFREGNSTVDVALALVVVITVMGTTTRRSAVAAAALSSAVGFTFFDTAPYDRFAITRVPDVFTAVLLVVVGLLTGELAVRVARQGRTDRTQSGNLSRVQQAASLLAHGEELVVMIGSVADDLTRLLDLRDCWFDAEPVEPGAWYVERDGEIRRSEHRGPVLRSAYRRSDQVALPVWGQGQVLGHFVLEVPRPVELTRDQLLVAITLADQVGAALIAQAPSIAWSSLPAADPPEDSADADPPAPHLRVIRGDRPRGIHPSRR
jgi:hypothetical protein